ncbi:pyridoxamine 5'-phosphate oxidase family protein [Sphingomicrobium sp. B8]|uniref:Pyridoxamine 5'-phosphate oxidase family protein n=2 Tax=Sphingomicrobium clamense TaxID=2851013 RepID=A0ABS6V7I1_9SPHN|nr:pyridoxamine 5'-phosphate oxidase family protein [Sphingomicrobium sp. B8]
MLANGVVDRSRAAHTPVVGTADGDQRIMVLRAFDSDAMTLRFHTDSRAPKCAVIEQDPAVHVLIYDRDRKVQLRLAGVGSIETEGQQVDDAWSEATNFARRCYLGSAPGAPSDIPTSGLPDHLEGVAPTDEQLVEARENFALLLVEIETIDWFFLDHHGHRRARIDLRDRGQETWLAP